MKYLHISVLVLALALYCAPAFAQHGHIGGSMGHGAADHSSMSNGSSSSSTHRMTIDQQLSKNTKLSGKIQNLTGMPAAC